MKEKGKILVLIPTYNERGNINLLIKEIENLAISNLDILVVDDGSTDGTQKELSRLTSLYRNVFVLQRGSKKGIGSAHIDGINWAYDRGYTRLITMDADLTHSPYYFRDLIKASKSYDLVIASRHLKKNSMIGWSLKRRFITFINHFFVSLFLGVKVDTSNSFRIYRFDRIPREVFKLILSNSYSFFFESIKILQINGFEIGEIPVVMIERKVGKSKLSVSDFISHFRTMTKLIFNLYFKKNRLRIK